MKLVVYHRTFFDWQLVSASEVKDGQIAVPSVHGPAFRHVQVHYDQPNTTDVVIPDSDIDRMVEDHDLGIVNARQGYTTTQVGGPLDGQEVVVPPRNLRHKTPAELIADHLADATFPFHFPQEDITKIVIVSSSMESGDQKKLERYLNGRFVQEVAS